MACGVHDTGPGVTEQGLIHLFDPYGSAKSEPGKGVGLGGARAFPDCRLMVGAPSDARPQYVGTVTRAVSPSAEIVYVPGRSWTQ